jgi:hypothetical protein
MPRNMASNEDQLVDGSCVLDQIIGESNGNLCLKCVKMKAELIQLQNELKSAQLIVKLLQDERVNQLSDSVNFHNLSNSAEEEMNQSAHH